MRRWLCIVGVIVLAGCAEDVVLGRYLTVSNDDGGALDSGTADASIAFDAGAPDAGASDAGAQADLQLRFVPSTLVVADSGVVRWQVEVANAGPSPALDMVLTMRWPGALPFSIVSGCDAGMTALDSGVELTCPPLVLASGAQAQVLVDLTAPVEVRALYIELNASSSTPELNPADNTGFSGLVTTPPPGPPMMVNAPTFFDFESCFGSNIFSFSQCVVGSRISQTFSIAADGSFGSPDGGGLTGDWQLGSDGGTVVFISPFRPTPGAYLGASTSASCAEGVLQAGTGRPYAGAWRGCFR